MKTEVAKSLNVIERRKLKTLEEVVERGVESFLATGSALKEIRDERLYREEFKSFDAYVKSKWGFARDYADRLITSSAVKEKVLTIVGTSEATDNLKSEGQLRELKSVPEGSLKAVIDKAAEIAGDKPPTAKVLNQAKKEVLAETTKDEAWEDVDDAETVTNDKPSSVKSNPKALAAPIQAVATQIAGIVKQLHKLSDDDGGEWLDMTDIETKATALRNAIRSAVYWVDCPDCGGKGCNTCKRHGWLSIDRKNFLTQNQKDKLGV